jgi:hypothetical protein
VRRKPNLALIRWSSTGLAPEGAPRCKPRRSQRWPSYPAMFGEACFVRALSGGDPVPPEHVSRVTLGRVHRGSRRSEVVLRDRRDRRGRRRRSGSARASAQRRSTSAMEGALDG